MRKYSRLAGAALGIAFAAVIGSACTAREGLEVGGETTAEVQQAISTAPLVWPTNFTPLKQTNGNLSDPTKDAAGSRDVVGTAALPAGFVASDANRLFFRIRLGSSPLKTPTSLEPFGWACQLDTDANRQTYEFIANVNGIVQNDAVLLSQNTVQGAIDSPSDKADVTLQTYSALVNNAQGTTVAHARVLPAGSDLGGNGGDFFIDFAIDVNDFPASFNPLASPFRLICGSSSNAQNISSDPVSPTNATTLSALGSDPVRCSATGCVAACFVDTDCVTTSFCNTQTNVCTPKLVNNTAIPTISGHAPPLTGVCSAAVGTSVCVAAVCDTTDNRCGFATGNGTCTAANAATVCRSGQCSPAGVCTAPGACTSDAQCASTQFCNTASSTCVPKLINSTPIPTIAGHTPPLNGTCSVAVGTSVCTVGVCDTADNLCGLANGSATCTVATAAVCRSGACSPNAGRCVPTNGCAVDADCASTAYCDTSVLACTPKLVNGTAIPTIAGHTPPLTGTCSAAVGTSVCVAAVCDTTDNRCGFTNGNGTCTAGNAATVCRSGSCSPAGVCAAPPGCTTDAQCTATQFCDTSSSTCTPKLLNGTAIPTIAGHAPPLTGTCNGPVGTSVCAAGVCDTNDNACAFGSGTGPCTTADAATVCRSGNCGTTGVCLAPGSCRADADCAASQFCNTATTTCVDKLVNGTAIPTIAGHTPPLTSTCTPAVGTSVCVAAVCDAADNLCGFAAGTGPCTAANAAVVCRTGSCAASGVCAAAPACTTDAQCSASNFCNTATSTCTPKLPNGTIIPTIAGHTPPLAGTCSVAVGTSVCSAGVCDLGDNRCGFQNGSGTCTPANASTLCRSGTCGTDSVCGKLDGEGCAVVTDCRSGVCNASKCGTTADGGVDAGPADGGPGDASGPVTPVDASTTPPRDASTTPPGDASATGDAGVSPIDEGILEGGGLACAVRSTASVPANSATLLVAALAVASAVRRRRRASAR